MTADLFGHPERVHEPPARPSIPLAERIRPKTLNEFVGQGHLLGPGKPLANAVTSRRVTSMILWGPPGCGKTTLARLLAASVNADYVELSAVDSGVKEVRSVIDRASKNLRHFKKQTILFIDEIHRFNKAQQDALLHSVEQGVVTLIGATTENPSFEVISPLLSRCRVFVLEPLGAGSLGKILDHALKDDDILKELDITVEDPALLFLLSGGDARKLLNGLESSVQTARTEKPEAKEILITNAHVQDAFQRAMSLYDKKGEQHYDIISAFIKSTRGSDPDAAVYWLARMLDGGEDPLFIARRMLVLASEDVGNADPQALPLAVACYQAVHSIGMPEARIVLSQTAVYLSCAPKSNASYRAIESALEDARETPNVPVPLHLRNAPTSLMKELGYGKDYKYAHNFEHHLTDQIHLPEALADRTYYEPTREGYEKSMAERLEIVKKKREENRKGKKNRG